MSTLVGDAAGWMIGEITNDEPNWNGTNGAGGDGGAGAEQMIHSPDSSWTNISSGSSFRGSAPMTGSNHRSSTVAIVVTVDSFIACCVFGIDLIEVIEQWGDGKSIEEKQGREI